MRDVAATAREERVESAAEKESWEQYLRYLEELSDADRREVIRRADEEEAAASGHPVPGADVRICFVGDSFVNGYGDPSCLGWVGRVCADAYQKEYVVTAYNLGVRRDTSRGIRARWEQECAARFPDGADNRVVFSFGANDSAEENGVLRVPREETLSHLREILMQARQRYTSLVVGPPPVVDEAHTARIKSLSDQMREVADAARVPYLPCYDALFVSFSWLNEAATGDGAHPLSHGYEQLADHVIGWRHWWFHEPRFPDE